MLAAAAAAAATPAAAIATTATAAVIFIAAAAFIRSVSAAGALTSMLPSLSTTPLAGTLRSVRMAAISKGCFRPKEVDAWVAWVVLGELELDSGQASDLGMAAMSYCQ